MIPDAIRLKRNCFRVLKQTFMVNRRNKMCVTHHLPTRREKSVGAKSSEKYSIKISHLKLFQLLSLIIITSKTADEYFHHFERNM